MVTILCVVCVLCALSGLVLYWLHDAASTQQAEDAQYQYDRWEAP